MSDQPGKAWDQQPGEPAAVYVRFLVYRGLGPCRSLDKAARAYGGSKGRAPGSWFREASAWKWRERADAFDIAHFVELGRLAIVKYLAVIDALATRALESLDNPGCGPQTWREVLDAALDLGRIIPPETILAVARNGRDPLEDNDEPPGAFRQESTT